MLPGVGAGRVAPPVHRSAWACGVRAALGSFRLILRKARPPVMVTGLEPWAVAHPAEHPLRADGQGVTHPRAYIWLLFVCACFYAL